MDLQKALDKITELEKEIDKTKKEYETTKLSIEELTKERDDMKALNLYLQRKNREEETKQTENKKEEKKEDNISFLENYLKGEYK